MKLVNDFFNKVCSEIDSTYFPEVKYYRDNKSTTKIHYCVELFNNGALTYNEFIKGLSIYTKETEKNIHKIISKYVTDFEDYTYKP